MLMPKKMELLPLIIWHNHNKVLVKNEKEEAHFHCLVVWQGKW